ncbi:MAG: Glu/Leu/Phe/Val dehydrogenase [Thermoanaerobaculales bacterium]|nr:Glu/Leu/Phe/Val dehydrogenase [Thermoanaerobaculales bacterium]
MSESSAFNPFEAAQAQFDRIADLMGLEANARRLLRSPAHEHHLAVPVRLDSGEIEVFSGFRIQHNDARGPAWGGVRFHPQETVDTVRALAMGATWKTAVADIPLGGSMGGVVCDPHDLSPAEQERVCRSWVRRVARTIGPMRDVPSPDIMASSQHMTWMLDEYEAIVGEHAPGAVTGKSIGAGGSKGRAEATGYGMVYVLREALRERGIEPGATTASLQGFGLVGRHAMDLYTTIGGTVRCVAALDSATGRPISVSRRDGIAVAELLELSDRLGGIDGGRAAERGLVLDDGEAWLAADVDILIPAALEHQITEANVDRVSSRVRLILEGANAPLSEAAEERLAGRGVDVIPDLLANAGGVICSYFEQVQSGMNYYWTQSEVLSKLDLKLTSAYLDVSRFAKAKGLSQRDAAMVLAVDRVADLCRQRGWL